MWIMKDGQWIRSILEMMWSEKESGTRLHRLHGDKFGFYSSCSGQPLEINVVGSDFTLKEIIVVAV